MLSAVTVYVCMSGCLCAVDKAGNKHVSAVHAFRHSNNAKQSGGMTTCYGIQDSLGGTANTALIICCSPSLDNAAETLSSLRFGVRARGIVSSVQVNAVKLLKAPSQLDTAKQLEVHTQLKS